MAYIGCVLFALMFWVLAGNANGTLPARLHHTAAWIHAWAPFSYLLILIVMVAPFASVKLMHSWPKRVEPEDPMAKYRHGDDAVDD
jgi:hypothetical protein